MSVAAVEQRIAAGPKRPRTRDAGSRSEAPLSEAQSTLLDHVDAFHGFTTWTPGDALLPRRRARSMPPYTVWLRGPDTIRPGCWDGGLSATDPDSCDGRVRFAGLRAVSSGSDDRQLPALDLIVLELAGERIAAWNSFLDTERLFPLFGLPSQLPAQARAALRSIL